MRVDKWLWTARRFKTRALAVKAVKGGRVHIDGNPIARRLDAGTIDGPLPGNQGRAWPVGPRRGCTGANSA
jgi:hypothetical protein